MAQALFAEYFRENRVITTLPNSPTHHLYIDSARIQNDTQEFREALHAVRADIHRCKANCSSKFSFSYQLLIRVFKSKWRRKWNKKRMYIVTTKQFTALGRYFNQGTHSFTENSKSVVDEINVADYGSFSFSR